MLWILLLQMIVFSSAVIYNTKQLLYKKGINSEIHEVKTKDGYILTLFRIPNPGATPMIVMPGFLSSSDCYVIGPTNESIVNSLYENGYDLWLSNYRGTKYGLKHVYLNSNKDQAQFWNYTFHEVGTQDVPAIMDYVADVTGHYKMLYMGHSMGCLVYYILCSERPEYCSRMEQAVFLAPVVFPPVKLKRFYLPTLMKTVKLFSATARAVGIHHLFQNDEAMRKFVYYFCKMPAFGKMCTLGLQTKDLVKQDIPSYIANGMTDSSIKMAEHLCQLMDGEHRVPKYRSTSVISNLNIFSRSRVPIYEGIIKTPIIMFYSDVDAYIDGQSLDDLRRRVTNIIFDGNIKDPGYDHMNFLYGKKTKVYVINNLLKILKQCRD